MALPHATTGSLRPAFTSARAVALAVKQASTYALGRPIANRPERAFVLLRYSFGGDRPSQTAQLEMSFARIHGTKLELKHIQGGISTLAPR